MYIGKMGKIHIYLNTLQDIYSAGSYYNPRTTLHFQSRYVKRLLPIPNAITVYMHTSYVGHALFSYSRLVNLIKFLPCLHN